MKKTELIKKLKEELEISRNNNKTLSNQTDVLRNIVKTQREYIDSNKRHCRKYADFLLSENSNLQNKVSEYKHDLSLLEDELDGSIYDVDEKRDDEMIAVAGDIVVELQKRGWSIKNIKSEIIKNNTFDI